jgi:hypothetical protein
MRDVDIDTYVDALMSEYTSQIKDWKSDVEIKGKNLKVANIEQASFLARYDEIRVELKALLDYYDMRVKQVRSEALQVIIKHASYDYNSTEKEKIIDSDPKYLKYKRVQIEINEMFNLLSSISDQFKNRAYTLNNLVKIYTAALEDITLF